MAASTIVFTGVCHGDGECSCWLVTKATYERLTGNKPTKFDRASKKRGLYRLYLDGAIQDKIENELKMKRDAAVRVLVVISPTKKRGTSHDNVS